MKRLALLLALSPVLLAPATAGASIAAVTDGQLRYTAGTGERNDGSIGVNEAGEYQIFDSGFGTDEVPMTAGPGCRKGSGHAEVVCSREGVTSIAVALGDRQDNFNLGEIPAPVSFSGGAGPDTVGYYRPEMVPLSITADDRPDDGPGGHDNIASDVENVRGGDFADTLMNGVGGGRVGGGAGDDRLMGNAGNDLIGAAYVEDVGTDSGSFYRQGSDTITCGGGQDFVYADSTDSIGPDCEAFGRDVPGKGFVFMGSNGPDRISAPYGWSPSVVYGRGGNDLLIGSFFSARQIVGGSGNDRIQGGDGYTESPQRLEGGSGNDRIRARDPRTPARQLVICGPGRDTAIVDRRDSVSGCERVLRSR